MAEARAFETSGYSSPHVQVPAANGGARPNSHLRHRLALQIVAWKTVLGGRRKLELVGRVVGNPQRALS
ncbi:conserved hypothetical protein [Histoplasma capsulatum H143]|uniref:Uncharacterized protein n=1 Tax=Ajellomyces capsulatus (strain H143) TaxID=544712 RepID=C6HSP2_AJECH|nr:conserved hypothetical protein [Histoplasma capsulatum H143]